MFSIRLSLPPKTFEHGVLAAVSGGADSTALLILLKEILPSDGKLAVAHVNHGLRGNDSDGDAAFVKNLAEEYQLRYFEHRIERKNCGGLNENMARELRYQFLVKQAESLGFRYLAAAHTADDQTETVLHRILRGTGLAGLAGISAMRTLSPAVTLLRPLLDVRRKEILAVLESHRKTFRQDQSNLENHYTRNRIRNRLLPMLRKEFNPQIDESLCRLASLAAEHEAVLTELLAKIAASAIIGQNPNQAVLNIIPLQQCSLPVLRSVLVYIWKQQGFPLQAMDFAQWQTLTELFRTELFHKREQHRDFPGGISAQRIGNRFVISRKQPNDEC